MILYYIVFLCALIALLLPYKKGQLVSWIVFFFMFLMSFYRNVTVGTDTLNYLIYSSEHRESEYIVTFIAWLIAEGDLDSRGIIYVTSLVTYIFSGLCVFKYKLDVRYFVLFFFLGNIFTMGMNISRQIAAVSITAYFVPFIMNTSFKKSLWFFLGIVLAYGFHYSSLFAVLLYPILRYVNIGKKHLGFIMLMVSPLLLFNIIPIDRIMALFIPDEYSSYSTTRTLTASLLGYIYKMFLLLLQYKLLSHIRDVKVCLFYVLGVITSNISIGMDSNVARIFLIYSFLNVIAIAHIGTLMRDEKALKKMPLYAMILISTYFCFIGIQTNPDLNNYLFYK